MNRSEYWNPRNETLSRDDLRALQYVKLKRLCDWAYAKSAFHRRRWDAAKFHPDQLKSLDDLHTVEDPMQRGLALRSAVTCPAAHAPQLRGWSIEPALRRSVRLLEQGAKSRMIGRIAHGLPTLRWVFVFD